MTDLEGGYCQVCGEEVVAAAEIRASDGDSLPTEATGVFESDTAHVQVSQRGVRVFVHDDAGGDGS